MQAASTSSVTKTFPGGIQALDALDIEVLFGEVFAVIGANGSGKTTLLQLLVGDLQPDTGRVLTLGVDPATRPKDLKAKIGYVPQHLALDPEMTGRETLSLFCTLYGLTGLERHRRVEALTADFGLAAVLSRRVSTYSGGSRQRLHVAIGMVHEPRLILLDEPTSQLDPDGCAFLWKTMRAYADRGHALVVVTHDLEDVTRQCDRVALLSRGKVRVLGTPQEIIAEHGQATVEVTLNRSPDEWEPVSRRLASVAGVTHVELRNRQIVLRLDEGPDAEAAVSAVLRETRVDVSAYRSERPNLSSAYFHVTGQDVLEDPAERPAGRSEGWQP